MSDQSTLITAYRAASQDTKNGAVLAGAPHPAYPARKAIKAAWEPAAV